VNAFATQIQLQTIDPRLRAPKKLSRIKPRHQPSDRIVAGDVKRSGSRQLAGC